jgi:hypothetical protein
VPNRPGSISELLGGLFWPSEPTTQTAIVVLLVAAAIVAVTIYGPLVLRLFRIHQLQRTIQTCFDEESSNAIQRQQIANAFAESPLAYHWDEFVRRWQNAIAADPLQDASLPELSRAPVRLTDVLGEHPVIPSGARRSLLPSLPAIFLSGGLLGAFAGLVLALPGIGLSLDPPSFDAANRSQQIGELMDHLGMALRVGLWGLLLSLAAAVSGRLIEGHADAQGETLDSWVQLAYGSISTGELTTRSAHEHRASISRVQADIEELLRQMSGRPRPVIRSTASIPGTAPAAEALDREAIESAVSSLGETLAAQLERTVSEQLAALRESIGGSLEGAGGQAAPSGDLADAVESLVKNSEAQNTASRSLTQTAHSISDAAEELRSALDDFAGVVDRMRETGEVLTRGAQRVEGAQGSTNRASELLAGSIDRSEAAITSQQLRLDGAIGEVRTELERMAGRVDRGLEEIEVATRESTAPAAAYGGEIELAIARLADRFDELTGAISVRADAPIDEPSPTLGDEEPELEAPESPSAAESSVEDLKLPDEDGAQDEPDLDEKLPADAEGALAADEEPTPPPPAPEPAPVAPSPAPPSEADTIPYMKAPDPEAIRTEARRAKGATGGSNSLSGLLRPTHHSGPSSGVSDEPRKLDPDATVVLERKDAERDESESGEEEDGKPSRRGIFGRRK